jgi:hypothetical protein
LFDFDISWDNQIRQLLGGNYKYSEISETSAEAKSSWRSGLFNYKYISGVL